MNACSEFSWTSRKGVIRPRKGEAHFSRWVKTLLVTLEIQTCMGDFAVENKYSIDSANVPPLRCTIALSSGANGTLITHWVTVYFTALWAVR
jgi:hypothetical protein